MQGNTIPILQRIRKFVVVKNVIVDLPCRNLSVNNCLLCGRINERRVGDPYSKTKPVGTNMVRRLQQYYQATCIAGVPEKLPHMDGVVLGTTDSFKCPIRLFCTVRNLKRYSFA